MKAIIFLSVLCFQLMILKAQQSQYFNKTELFTPVLNTIQSVIEADSHYVVLFGIVDSMNIQKAGLAKIDKQGNLIKQEIWGAQDTLLAIFPGNSLIRTEDSGYIVCGMLINANNEMEGFITKFDNQLSMQFTRHYHHPDSCTIAQPGAYVYNTFTAIRQTWDGGFIISGNYSRNCDSQQMRSYLLKTDSLGVMEWISKYNGIQRISSIITSPDSGYFFPTAYNGHLCVIKTDPVGNILWNVKVNSNTHPSFPMDLTILNDSHLVVVSSFWYDLTLNLSAVTVAKVNFIAQKKQWEKNFYLFRNFKCHSLHQTVSIHTLPDASVVIGSTSMVHDPQISGTAEYKGVMMKLSQEGDSLWARYYHYGKFKDVCQFNHFVTTQDGGFLAVGYYQPIPPGNASWSAWLVKMDSLGCDTPGCHLIGIEDLPARQHGDMTLYPNPFSHELNIVLPNGPAGATATLYDMQGRMMQQTRIPEHLHTNHYTLQTNDLSPGIYILHLVTRDGVTHVGRVVRGR